MRHRLVTLCSALSLLLCVAVCVAWATSYRSPRLDYYDWLLHGPPVEVRSVYWKSDNGAHYLTLGRYIAETKSDARFVLAEPSGFRKMGFARRPPLGGVTDGFFRLRHVTKSKTHGDYVSVYAIGAPYWFVALTTAVLPLVWFVRRVRGRRRGARQIPGRCPACGYDLRATPGRCPECGAEPKGTTA